MEGLFQIDINQLNIVQMVTDSAILLVEH
ncbi:hypothetical protein VCR31J2_110078 [Vibrio coralliirubri]|uniref:Uncharacterized protein n=1 Tax=Vibrio coralliirubri TaxID=1516159 RepID=A0AA86WR73_9VIBR|nr:hypothetical protein VCR31J2_110078 [Vibrio coralliirubri]